MAAAQLGEAAPDPIEHAAPDVELAEAQLAVGRPEPELADEAEPDAEEEFDEEELESEPDGGAPALAPTLGPDVPGPRARQRSRLIGFLQGSWRELQRVQWPDRRQVAQATAVVVGFVIVAGVFLGVADLLAGHVVTLILNGHW